MTLVLPVKQKVRSKYKLIKRLKLALYSHSHELTFFLNTLLKKNEVRVLNGAHKQKATNNRRAVIYGAFGANQPYKTKSLEMLARSGCDVYISVNRKNVGDAASYQDYAIEIIDRPNVGRDIGCFKSAITAFDLTQYDYIYFVNDSICGPWKKIDAHFDAFENSAAEVFGMSDSFQGGIHHVQSYFFGVRQHLYRSKSFKEFWQSRKNCSHRFYAIHEGEFALSRFFHRFPWYIVSPYNQFRHKYLLGDINNNSFSGKAAMLRNLPVTRDYFKLNLNQTHYFWKEMIDEKNIPIIKMDLITINPEYIENIEFEFSYLVPGYWNS